MSGLEGEKQHLKMTSAPRHGTNGKDCVKVTWNCKDACLQVGAPYVSMLHIA